MHDTSDGQFIYHSHESRVIFGVGTIATLGAEVKALGMSRPLVLTTPHQAQTGAEIGEMLGDVLAGLCPLAEMHTPVEITELALERLRESGADGIVSVGGGSTIGLGKALSVRSGLPHLTIPTTYAGSEMTSILGETANGVKTTRRDPAILPSTVIYDVNLTLGLPVAMSVTSGINAMAHAVEALYAPDRNPVITMIAERAITLLAEALPMIVQNPEGIEGRKLCLEGSWLAGICLGAVSMAIHHKLCHTLGGTFDLPHAETHTVILPYATAYVGDAAPEAMTTICRALGVNDAASGLRALCEKLGAPTSLAEIGMPESGIERAADLAMENQYSNPRPLEREGILNLLRNAHAGRSLSS